MKRNLFIILCCTVSTMLSAQHQDCRLWYDKPAKDWNEALPVGNGRLGAMVYGDYCRETIQLNEESLWAGAKSDANAESAAKLPEIQQLLLNGEIGKAVELSEKYMKSDPLRIRSYQSFGNIYIDLLTGSVNPAVSDYKRELDLETGITSVSYALSQVTYKREVFVSAENDVVVIRLSADRPGALTFRLHYDREQDATAYPVSANELEIKGQIVDLPEAETGAIGPHMRFSGRIAGFHKGGQLMTLNNGFYVEKADEVVFFLTAATDYNLSQLDVDREINPSETCQRILARLGKDSYEKIKQTHITEHSSLFNRVTFNMGESSVLPTDRRLERVKNADEFLPDTGCTSGQFARIVERRYVCCLEFRFPYEY